MKKQNPNVKPVKKTHLPYASTLAWRSQEDQRKAQFRADFKAAIAARAAGRTLNAAEAEALERASS